MFDEYKFSARQLQHVKVYFQVLGNLFSSCCRVPLSLSYLAGSLSFRVREKFNKALRYSSVVGIYKVGRVMGEKSFNSLKLRVA